jgi:hypothetical protein
MEAPAISQLRSGPPTVSLLTAAAAIGIGRTKAYELARRDEFPVAVRRVGATYRVPVAELLRSCTPTRPTARQPRVPVNPRTGTAADARQRVKPRTSSGPSIGMHTDLQAQQPLPRTAPSPCSRQPVQTAPRMPSEQRAAEG